MSSSLSVSVPFLLLCPHPLLLPPLFIVLQLQPLKLDNTMGDRGGGPLGEAGWGGCRRVWIKGPPVLHRMINDLLKSGGPTFFDRAKRLWAADKGVTDACLFEVKRGMTRGHTMEPQ